MRLIFIIYGILSYCIFLATALYAIGFVGNFFVPKSMDSVAPTSLVEALLVNFLLLSIFSLQHSIMAREGFKRKLIKLIPSKIERSTYVLFSSLALGLIFWQWKPIGGIVWDVSNTPMGTVLIAVSISGWAVVFFSTFLLDHFEFFGLKQVFSKSNDNEILTSDFRTPALYKYVRHPIYFGFTLAFWATPQMTYAHLIFATGMLFYTLIGVKFEERDLVTLFGNKYRTYQSKVPMLIPFLKKKSK